MTSIKRDNLVKYFLYGIVLIIAGVVMRFLHIPYLGSIALWSGLILDAILIYIFMKEYR